MCVRERGREREVTASKQLSQKHKVSEESGASRVWRRGKRESSTWLKEEEWITQNFHPHSWMDDEHSFLSFQFSPSVKKKKKKRKKISHFHALSLIILLFPTESYLTNHIEPSSSMIPFFTTKSPSLSSTPILNV